ncbi:hypothetical protein BS50DRAFT_139186 [Corynespora cassiicola Philippines]|uniref:Glucose receptor Git3 N-terminal domain-containing protein n=1 Tax=Corynespora cassiicola Philippines TaxID=1448308 RepID=A0A2T2NAV0_CORCC|nr:hypothetical protein BS50DRAFT_139186 [Corynespora cassiicola Philippines]
MLLIYGDLMKATWLFLFAAVSIARGTVYTESAFCQASGFLVQYGTETSDYAVLVMAVHSTMQVFRPSTQGRSGGLYPHRRLVYLGGVAIPGMMAGLAFVNPHWGYMSQGAFCTLPHRPFWYRLALAWIPRYLISVIILGLAIAIYAHVGFEFRSFANMSRDTKPSVSTTTPILSTENMEFAIGTDLQRSHVTLTNSPRRASSIVHDLVTSRRPSTTVTTPALDLSISTPILIIPPERSHSLPTSPLNLHIPDPRPHLPPPETSNTTLPSPTTLRASPPPLHTHHLTTRHAHIHRQLRLMFIYPLVYILMWIFPFVAHCMMYQDHYAAHPVYWLMLLNFMCVTLMGTVDCLVFSLRERPWRFIRGADGTFWGRGGD